MVNISSGAVQEVADQEAASKANEALQPVRAWLQSLQSTEHSAFTTEEQEEAPTGYFTRESKTTHDSGPGNDVSASQHTTEAGKWTTGETGSQAAQTFERQATDRARSTREAQMGQAAVQTTTEAGSWTTGETGSTAAQTFEREATDRARNTREAQMEHGALQNANDLQVNFHTPIAGHFGPASCCTRLARNLTLEHIGDCMYLA